jgi:hypothetical protein
MSRYFSVRLRSDTLRAPIVSHVNPLLVTHEIGPPPLISPGLSEYGPGWNLGASLFPQKSGQSPVNAHASAYRTQGSFLSPVSSLFSRPWGGVAFPALAPGPGTLLQAAQKRTERSLPRQAPGPPQRHRPSGAS